MKNEALISIIVPVYNTSKYLSNCLDSILDQTYENVEIIVIDDGSTDDSLKIMKKYAQENTNIRYFTQNNHGQATARNKGINVANGEYIMFVDSDDYVSRNFCQVAYRSICKNHADIAFFDFYTESNKSSNKITFNFKEGLVTKEEAIMTTIFSSFPFNKIYKISLFNNIKYPESKKYEDLFTTYKLINIARRVSYVKKALYYYVQRDDSTVHHHTTRNMTDYFQANQQLFNFIKEEYPRLKGKMVNSVLQGSLYFLAYADKKTDQKLINQAQNNLNELSPQQFINIKWMLMLQLYKLFPQIVLKLFKKKVLNKNNRYD